jgi:4'-phosphopantetheinyl transferase
MSQTSGYLDNALMKAWNLSMNEHKAIPNLSDVRSVSIGHQSERKPVGSGPGLKNDVIDIWSAYYTDLDPYYETLSASISGEERKKASRFRRPGDGCRFILRRGFLRFILSYYTGLDPSGIPLVISENGKPELDPHIECPVFSFSLSHTDRVVTLGITKKYQIGLDMVKPEHRYPFQDTAAYLFNSAERSIIAGMQPDIQYRQFFRIWALKEALLKATGGTVQMMREMDVSRVVQYSLANGWYPVRCRDTEQVFFIYESGWDYEYHYVVAASPGR